MNKKKDELNQNTREVILHAAIKEFIEYGFYGARMQRIAEASKVNKAMIYYYFASKELVYTEVLKNIFTTIFTKLNALPVESSSVREMIGHILTIYENVFREYPDYIRLFLYELASEGKNLKNIKLFKINPADLPFNPVSGRIYLFFQKKIKEKEIKKVDFFQLLISILSQIIIPYAAKPIFDSILSQVPLPVPNLYQNLLKHRKEFIIDLVMNGIKN